MNDLFINGVGGDYDFIGKDELLFTTSNNATGSSGTFTFDGSLWGTYSDIAVGFKFGTGDNARRVVRLLAAITAGLWRLRLGLRQSVPTRWWPVSRQLLRDPGRWPSSRAWHARAAGLGPGCDGQLLSETRSSSCVVDLISLRRPASAGFFFGFQEGSCATPALCSAIGPTLNPIVCSE